MNLENAARQPEQVTPLNEKEAYTRARQLASLVSPLPGNESSAFSQHHLFNLTACYQQFEDAISEAGIMRLLRATHLISELRQRKKLLTFYEEVNNEIEYPTRLLYYGRAENKQTAKSPADGSSHDHTVPTVGKFFQDLGEMIRTMVCEVDENSTEWEAISIRGEYYFAITCGYLDGAGRLLTKTEKANLHYSGLLAIYLQTLRFVTDFLRNDSYYKISYPEQNLNRALNQYILMEQLEEFLEKKYHFLVTP